MHEKGNMQYIMRYRSPTVKEFALNNHTFFARRIHSLDRCATKANANLKNINTALVIRVRDLHFMKVQAISNGNAYFLGAELQHNFFLSLQATNILRNMNFYARLNLFKSLS